ncbi:MAG: hypothetical protein ACFFAO_21125 [Candidatus Hermodarchaeota archaeon]
MGVKLGELIVRRKINYSQLNGKIIAIDAPNIIFGFFNYSLKPKNSSTSKFLMDRTQRVISHLYGMLYRINFLYSLNLFPIFCFDGREPELKRKITKNYLNDFNFAKKMYRKAIREGNLQSARNISLSKEFLWSNMISESKLLLNALGIPFLESPASSEAQCAYLVKKKIANFANSQDFDILLHGCPHILQNLKKSLRKKVKGKWIYKRIEPYYISLEENLKILRLDQFQLIDLAILIGTDYNKGIHGIGALTALELIKKYRNIEGIIYNKKDQYDFNQLTPEVITKIRKIFLIPEVIENIDDLTWNLPNKTELMRLLCEDHYLNKERVERILEKIVFNYEKCKNNFQNKKKYPKLIQKTLDTII